MSQLDSHYASAVKVSRCTQTRVRGLQSVDLGGVECEWKETQGHSSSPQPRLVTRRCCSVPVKPRVAESCEAFRLRARRPRCLPPGAWAPRQPGARWVQYG